MRETNRPPLTPVGEGLLASVTAIATAFIVYVMYIAVVAPARAIKVSHTFMVFYWVIFLVGGIVVGLVVYSWPREEQKE